MYERKSIKKTKHYRRSDVAESVRKIQKPKNQKRKKEKPWKANRIRTQFTRNSYGLRNIRQYIKDFPRLFTNIVRKVTKERAGAIAKSITTMKLELI